MRTNRFALLAATTTLGLTGLISALPSQADPAPLPANTLPTDCLHIQYGSDTYSATYTQPKKKKDPAVLVTGTVHLGFEIGTDSTQSTKLASCAAATYTVHVKNFDRTTQQDTNVPLDYQGFTASPDSGTAATVDPSQVDITWNGDGTTSDYSATVTTGPSDPSVCIDAWVTSAVAGQQTAETNHVFSCLDSGAVGNTFFG